MNDLREYNIMIDFEPDKYVDAYCRRQKCKTCEGTDINGEPNGYGCQGLEDRQERMYNSILKRRLNKLKK